MCLHNMADILGILIPKIPPHVNVTFKCICLHLKSAHFPKELAEIGLKDFAVLPPEG